jgi:hypothetical protein
MLQRAPSLSQLCSETELILKRDVPFRKRRRLLCTEMLTTDLMIEIDNVLLQGYIRVHVICRIARGAAPRGVEASAAVQLTGTCE